MDEKPKSIWKKSLKLPGLFSIWLGLMMATMLIFAIIIWLNNDVFNKPSDFVGLLIFGVVFATILLCFWLFIRWIFCWRNFKRFIFGCACLATLIALFYAEEDWRGKHDWEKFKREWEAKGEHFDFASVVPPPVPDDQNFALMPVVASSYEYILDKNGHKLEKQNTNVVNRLEISIGGNESNWKDWPTNGYWAKHTLTDLRGWQQFYRDLSTKTNLFPVTPQPQSPAQDVLLALSKYDSTVEELRQASQLPKSRFPLNYDTECPADIMLPHLSAMKSLCQLLQLRAIAELQNGQGKEALADVKLTLYLVGAIRNEPFLISHLVRFAMTEIALQPIYEGLAEHRWSDEQLVALDAELAKLDFLADYQFSMRGERAMNCAVIDYISKKQSYQQYQAFMGEMWNKEGVTVSGQLKLDAQAVGFYLMPAGWFAQNKLFIARGQQGWITGWVFPEEHLVSPQKCRQVDQSQSGFFNHPAKPWNFLAKEFLPALGAAGRKSSREQISVDLARVAIALERYRLAHGNFPESLDVLAPQFMEKIPHDVIGGQPLKYQRDANGQFVLYSVGWNEKDDGGITGHRNGGSAPDFDSGDWVWRYPSK